MEKEDAIFGYAKKKKTWRRRRRRLFGEPKITQCARRRRQYLARGERRPRKNLGVKKEEGKKDKENIPVL